nr:response regulator [Deltaproteobacteria bacterium]
MEAHSGKVIEGSKSLLTEDDTHSPKVQTRPDEVPFLEIIEKNADGIIIADCNGVLRYMNPAAEFLFERDAKAFIGEIFGFPLVGGEKAEIDIFRRQKGLAVAEMRVVDFKWEGRPAYLATLRDITERKRIEEALNETTRDLEETIRELTAANQQILKQQKKVVEEERLKVLLQMAGATAHELNQPLAILLMNIELLEEEKDIPLRLTPYIDDISESGTRIAQIIKRIQSIRSADAASANRPSAVLNLDQKIEILCLEDSDVDFGALASFFKDQNQITLCRAKTIETGISHAMTGGFDMIFLDFMLPDGTGLDFLKKMQERALETPVVVITGQG